jgi:hypothetical protein
LLLPLVLLFFFFGTFHLDILDVSLLIVPLLLWLQLVPFAPPKIGLEQPASETGIDAAEHVDVGEAEEPGEIATGGLVIKVEYEGALGLGVRDTWGSAISAQRSGRDGCSTSTKVSGISLVMGVLTQIRPASPAIESQPGIPLELVHPKGGGIKR